MVGPVNGSCGAVELAGGVASAAESEPADSTEASGVKMGASSSRFCMGMVKDNMGEGQWRGKVQGLKEKKVIVSGQGKEKYKS